MKSVLSIAATCIILSSVALAEGPLAQGPTPPPVDRWLGYTLGAQYEYSDMDFRFEGAKQNFDIQAVYATFTAPLSPRWDFLLRLGGANASSNDVSGTTEWAWGMGLHAIVAAWGDFTLDATGQIESVTSSTRAIEGVLDANDVLQFYEGRDELSFFEYNLMVGPTWSHGPLSLSAGAMVRYVTGDFDFTSRFGGFGLDMDHRARVGGYVGADFDVTNTLSISGNVQLDEDLTRVSAGLLWWL
jgi:hypothetical protein